MSQVSTPLLGSIWSQKATQLGHVAGAPKFFVRSSYMCSFWSKATIWHHVTGACQIVPGYLCLNLAQSGATRQSAFIQIRSLRSISAWLPFSGNAKHILVKRLRFAYLRGTKGHKQSYISKCAREGAWELVPKSWPPIQGDCQDIHVRTLISAY